MLNSTERSFVSIRLIAREVWFLITLRHTFDNYSDICLYILYFIVYC